MVIVQEIFGVNGHIRDLCDRYAADGFEAIAPALFDRARPSVELDYNPEARARVAEIRQEVAHTFNELGASHLQLGRSYGYAETLEPGADILIRAIKQALDPDRRINPGVLGL